MVKLRLQSAMEYLMTYGWAILIIAVVLGALFALGIFNSAAFLGTACVAQSGYLCQNPLLDTNGSLTFTFGQATGITEYNISLACSAAINASGGPLNQTLITGEGGAWNANASTAYSWDPSGVPYLNYTEGNAEVPSGSVQTIYNLDCYDSSGLPIGLCTPPHCSPSFGTYNLTVGQSYTGTIWVAYSLTPNTLPTQVERVATLAVKVS